MFYIIYNIFMTFDIILLINEYKPERHITKKVHHSLTDKKKNPLNQFLREI